MLSFAVTNIANKGREIFVFHRIGEKLSIFKDITFKPYYYQLDANGLFRTIDNKKAKKITCNKLHEISQRKDDSSYEADVHFCKRYAIDKITSFLPAKLKYSFIDIEVLCKALPSYQFPDSPISCISASNSYNEEIKTWYLGDLPYSITEFNTQDELEDAEKQLLNDFVTWIKEQQLDFIAAWNMLNFDWRYLCARYEKVFGTSLADMVSPIFANHIMGNKDQDQITLPSGLGIVDYLDWYKKIYKSKQSYALDSVAQDELEETSFDKIGFDILSDNLKEKNINDVRRMMKLEAKLHVIDYYDELRRMSKSVWEDLTWNSKMLDMMVLTEARQRNLILPSKKYDQPVSEECFEGAYRRCNIEDEEGNITERLTGLYEGLWKVDLGSAYPRSIIDFCLDVQNIRIEQNEGILINSTKFFQNSGALLPSIARKLINKKNELKKQLKTLDPESKEAKDLQTKYDAVKGVVNSLFGVCGLKVFRLYDMRVASAITFLVRDLLHYVEEKVQEKGMRVIYLDTDSLFLTAPEPPTELLNNLVKQWAKEKYGKDNIGIEFELEGKFKKLFIVSLCHYVGLLETKKGIKKEIKGVEIKRADSSKFMKEFQEQLIDAIMAGATKIEIDKLITKEKERVKTLPLTQVGFPCRLTGKTDYASPPIFLRGCEYTKVLNPSWNKVAGDSFFYIPVQPFGTSIRKSSRMKGGEKQYSEKEIKKDVLCFDDTIESQDLVRKMGINWDRVIEKSIDAKVDKSYEAMGWIIEPIEPESAPTYIPDVDEITDQQVLRAQLEGQKEAPVIKKRGRPRKVQK